jgi:hypothetical protein
MTDPRKQLYTWLCGPCERWVAVEVQPGVSPICPVCGTANTRTRPVDPRESAWNPRLESKP